MLTAQAALILHAIGRNAPTVDEPYHLTAGLRYWDTGEFWCYHQNPPLTRLTAALPLILLDAPRVHGDYTFRPDNRNTDELVREDFTRLHRQDFCWWLNIARSTSLLYVLLGGWIVFRWSHDLYGRWGSLISLCLWIGSPWILGHGMLVTPDVGAAALMVAASYAFWRYLRAPSLRGAFYSGCLLGLAQAAKFTAVALVPIWLLAVVTRVWTQRLRAPATPIGGPRRIPAAGWLDAAVVLCASLLVLNSIYLFEGTGRRLGSFDFRSPSLGGDVADAAGVANADSRLLGTMLQDVPIPLPRHYLLGFDAQLWDLEQRPFYKYLGGELRTMHQSGWWYYYVYGMLMKTPVAALLLMTASLALLVFRRDRTDLTSALMLVGTPAFIFVALSLRSNLNSHVRYIIPALPFLFVLAGNLGPWCTDGRILRCGVIASSTIIAFVSGVSAHPYHIAYFNAIAGGPDHGLDHLSDSNVDWGQGLLALRDWLDENAPNVEIQLAYVGAINPEDVGVSYRLLDPYVAEPGIHVVSATLLTGMPSYVYAPHACRTFTGPAAYVSYGRLSPVARLGHVLFVYRFDEAILADLRHTAEL